MEVVHVVRQFHPSVGGLQEVVQRLAVALAEHGCRSRVVTLDRAYEDMATRLDRSDRIEGVDVVRVPFRGSQRYPLAPGLITQIASADLVHVHGIDFAFDYLSATRLIHRKPLVVSTHGGFFHSGFARRLKQLYFLSVTRLAAMGYRRVYAVSENDSDTFSRIVQPSRLLTIENGVDVDKFYDSAGPADARTLIYFGRIARAKNLQAVFPVLAALRRTNPPWRLIVAGREWDLTFAEVKAWAREHGVEAEVQLVDGPDVPTLRRLIGQASHFVSLSSYEGFGLAAVEAMSAGLVPVLSDIAPFRRLAHGNAEVLILDAPDAAENAARIAESCRRLATRTQHVRESLRAAAQAYTWPSIARRYLLDYQSVLGCSEIERRAS